MAVVRCFRVLFGAHVQLNATQKRHGQNGVHYAVECWRRGAGFSDLTAARSAAHIRVDVEGDLGDGLCMG